MSWPDDWSTILTAEKVFALTRAGLLLVAGWIAASLASRAVHRLLRDRLEPQGAILLRRAVYAVLLGLFTVAALHQLGFNLGVLLGAAGVLSVAIGFASQTSASNFISGLFLIAERPFSVGDVIRIGGTTGEVLSIDLLSVKLRTFDNLFVRIPNENLIKTEVVSLTRFPLRRADLKVGIAYKEDLERVREILFRVADRNPLAMDEPKPMFQVLGFGESSIDLQFSVWGQREVYIELRNTVQREIHAAFRAEGIEIPFPQRSLVAGGDGALPVRLAGGDEPEPSAAPADEPG